MLDEGDIVILPTGQLGEILGKPRKSRLNRLVYRVKVPVMDLTVFATGDTLREADAVTRLAYMGEAL